jgi:hypothetical protein
MVNLIHRQNKVEVRLKKYPLDQDAYFEEYVKLGAREPATAPQNRYVIADDNATYAVEIVLKSGFNFEDYSWVRATLTHLDTVISIKDWYRPGNLDKSHCIREDTALYLEADDPIVGGKIMKGAKFAFQSLTIGKEYGRGLSSNTAKSRSCR